MKQEFVIMATFVILLITVTMTNSAFAEKSETSENGLQTIMDNYRKAVQKAQADFLAAVDKANDDARNAIYKGLPIDQINANTKSAIEKAREDLKDAIQDARADAKAALLALKAEVDTKASK